MLKESVHANTRITKDVLKAFQVAVDEVVRIPDDLTEHLDSASRYEGSDEYLSKLNDASDRLMKAYWACAKTMDAIVDAHQRVCDIQRERIERAERLVKSKSPNKSPVAS